MELFVVSLFIVSMIGLTVAMVLFKTAVNQQTRAIAAMHETLLRDCGAELDD